jgi:hypothetical protein
MTQRSLIRTFWEVEEEDSITVYSVHTNRLKRAWSVVSTADSVIDPRLTQSCESSAD